MRRYCRKRFRIKKTDRSLMRSKGIEHRMDYKEEDGRGG
jgi:hypothetical protein